METTLKLCYPVLTLDRKELLPAGVPLTSDTMTELVRSARGDTFPTMRLLEYGTIARDLLGLCEHPPYNQIFSDQKRTKAVFDSIQRLELVQPLLDIYDHFKACDPFTYRHILIVFAVSVLLCQDFIEDQKKLARKVVAASNHDLGKICVPLEILTKSSQLDENERKQLGHHVAAGYVLLSYYLKNSDHPATMTARDHHERCDGSGYPCQIALKNQIVEIVAVGDVFDALISPRPYRPHSYDLRTALDEITLMAERGRVSADVVNALISCNRKGQPHYADCLLSHERRGTPPSDNLYRGAIPCQIEPESKTSTP